jgi:hypothetical protein
MNEHRDTEENLMAEWCGIKTPCLSSKLCSSLKCFNCRYLLPNEALHNTIKALFPILNQLLSAVVRSLKRIADLIILDNLATSELGKKV